MSYYFAPMMPIYNRLLSKSTRWHMANRSLIAQAIRHCRNQHGRQEARRFLDALYCVGCIYPLLRI